ncbi:MAG: hypothetical protein E7006_01860 [Alphaproteobacteria bacterium]|nr:hypothetical protein [Alphaproteobacteria bacterium]
MAEYEFMKYEQLVDLILGEQGNIWGYLYRNAIWAQCFEYLSDSTDKGQNDFDSLQESVRAMEKDLKTPEERKKYEILSKFISDVKKAKAAPYDSMTNMFKERLESVLRAYYASDPNPYYNVSNINPTDGERYKMITLQKVKTITDEAIQYRALKALSQFASNNRSVSESEYQANIMCANNKHATSADLLRLMYCLFQRHSSAEEILKVFQDLDALARKEITAELSKESPNLEKIKHIINMVEHGAYYTGNEAIQQQVKQVYDLDKILLPNGTEYISKAPDVQTKKIEELNARITALQAQVAELNTQLEEKNAQVQKLNNELGETKQTLEDARTQNQTLNSENSALRQENDSLGQSKTNNEDKLHQLIESAKKLKGGIFSGRELDDFKRMAAEIESKTL